MRQGFLHSLPFAAGAAAYGFAFGVVAAQLGFSWWSMALMSITVHSSSAQIVATQQFATEGLILGAALAGVALNLRFLVTIASLHEILSELPFIKRLLTIQIVGDETWALTLAKRAENPAVGARFLIGSGLTMIGTWTLSTAAGAMLGQALPNMASYGLGFIFTAAFIALARALWRDASDLLPWLLSATSTVALMVLGLDQAFAILVGAACGLALCIELRRRGQKV